MRWMIFSVIILLSSCMQNEEHQDKILVSGTASDDVEYLSIGKDTIEVVNGAFSDTLLRQKSQYNYLKVSTWKWPRIVYLETGESLNLNFSEKWINTGTNKLNEYLLNKDSILSPYSARWDMNSQAFRKAWQSELPINIKRINCFFDSSDTPLPLINELIQMEYMLRGHYTANFKANQEKQGSQIDKNTYDFVDSIDMNNERLSFHANNRNFQYYYYLDKVGNQLPDSIYPFAVVDTVNKYVTVTDIKNMIISGVVKSGLYNETVNHDALFKLYEENISDQSKEKEIVNLYNQIQKLKPGNQAPGFGELINLDGEPMRIEKLKGKNILLSSWGTWCPYCKAELPHLKALLAKYPDKVSSVAISLDKEAKKWKDYVQENDWEGIHLNDPGRASTFKKNYLISGTNVYYLIDKNGVIISSGVKPSETKLESLIQELN